MHRLSSRVRAIGLALTALVLSVLAAPIAPAQDATPAVNTVVEWNQHANDALLAAGDMTGRDGITARGLTPELLLSALDEARRRRSENLTSEQRPTP